MSDSGDIFGEEPGGEEEQEEAENIEEKAEAVASENVNDVDDVNTVNQVKNQAAEHEAAAEAGDSEAAAEDVLAEEDAAARAETVDPVDQDDPVGKTDTAVRDQLKRDNDALQAEIEQLRQELSSAQAEATEATEAYQARIDLLKGKLLAARNEAQESRSRLTALESRIQQSREQADSELTELRKQSAFMKKNIAALHAELDEARRSVERRGKVMVGFGVLLTILAAVLISRGISGCRERVESLPATTGQPSDTRQADSGTDRTDDGVASGASGEAVAWPTLRIDGLSTEAKRDHLVIRFNEGAFSSLTNISTAAAAQIKTLAGQLRPDLANYRFVVEGHTDNIPMRPTGTFANNAALAAARAETAVDLLKSEGASAIAAASPGPPPYPNDTPDNRRRNRTLVIRLYQ